MAIYTNLPVYEDTYQLFLQLILLSSKMQRDFKFTVGEQIKKTLIDMMVLIYKANKSMDKVLQISLAREKLVEVQLIIRVFNDTRQISDKQFVLLAERTTSISKQLACWEKSSHK